MPEARGGGQEEHPTSKEQWLRRRRRTERSYSMFKVRRGSCDGCAKCCGKELPHFRGQGRWPGGPTPRPRPGAAAGRTNHTSKERWLRGRRRA